MKLKDETHLEYTFGYRTMLRPTLAERRRMRPLSIDILRPRHSRTRYPGDTPFNSPTMTPEGFQRPERPRREGEQ